jgi:hypothetical protein
MIDMVKSPSTRVLSKGCLAAWLAVSLAFAALLVAPDAQAHGTHAPNRAADTSIGEGATEGGVPTEQVPPPAGQGQSTTEQATTPAPTGQGQSTTEQSQSTAEEATTPAPTGQGQSTTEQSQSTTEQSQPATEQTKPPAEEPIAPAEPIPPAAEATPPAQTPPTTKEVPPEVEDGNVKQPVGEVAVEAGSDGAASEDSEEDSQVSGAASRPSPEDTASEVAAGVATAVTASAAPGVLPEGLTSPAQSQSSIALGPGKISIRRARQATCELAGIGVEITVGHAGEWLEISTTSSDLPAPFAIAGTSRTATTSGAPAGSQDGGSAVENHPPSPFPGPGPGGAGGGAAAGGGPGSAVSASFTLAGVLLQAEPRAMRRWRLSQPSWRTSFFVLIPERPD